ncbi:diphthamide biosynthesis protein 2 [Asbolus verrucosus]|uniref:Diphthamide biosynthesis protein 2 n=1 Tax=Asbolus verrucosus TaxID=1661398 RepID=A0A482VPU6_ASBVE|nr:diphthamide biosynthesis protein 2 [Asbolus verrucosus]
MSQFFTNEAVSLQREIGSVANAATAPQLLDEVYEIGRCLEWVRSNDFKKVCLQFPDHLLADSCEVALRLERGLKRTVYVLADTAYESCCVDYVAAAHVGADAVIHFGPVCFSETSAAVPHLKIYEKDALDLDAFHRCLAETFPNGGENVVILLDTSFVHLEGEFAAKFPRGTIKRIDSSDLSLENTTTVFVGGRNQHRKLPNLKFSYKPENLYYYRPEQAPSLINYEQDEKVLRRRYFLIEKIKDSNTIGIVIGTLAVKNYLEAIERIKKLIRLHKKKYYVVSVGKPTVAKLANFPEIDIYVMVTCALNDIYDNRDYYKPIVTMYDVEMALNPSSEGLGFTYDYNDFLSRPISEVVDNNGDVSLLTGKIRGNFDDTVGAELVAKGEGVVALNTAHGAGFLAARSWKGLERGLGENEVKMAEEGRRGIAQHYSEEINNFE